jgi:hypothetical protein
MAERCFQNIYMLYYFRDLKTHHLPSNRKLAPFDEGGRNDTHGIRALRLYTHISK